MLVFVHIFLSWALIFQTMPLFMSTRPFIIQGCKIRNGLQNQASHEDKRIIGVLINTFIVLLTLYSSFYVTNMGNFSTHVLKLPMLVKPCPVLVFVRVLSSYYCTGLL